MSSLRLLRSWVIESSVSCTLLEVAAVGPWAWLLSELVLGVLEVELDLLATAMAKVMITRSSNTAKTPMISINLFFGAGCFSPGSLGVDVTMFVDCWLGCAKGA